MKFRLRRCHSTMTDRESTSKASSGYASHTLLGHRLSIKRTAILSLLNQLCNDNIDYYSKYPTFTSYGERLVNACQFILECSDGLKDIVTQLQDIAPNYDYDEKTPGNGFRSLVCICDTTVLHLISLLKDVSEQRTSFVFRFAHYCKEIEAYATIVQFLLEALPECIENEKILSPGSIFPRLDGDYSKYHEILKQMERFDYTCFYGRPLGFQFSPSVNRIFRVIGIVLASYSLSWEKGHGPIGSIINTGRFFLSPEQRALRIIKVTKEADIDFCKGFWNLAELSNVVPKWFCPNMAVNELRTINWIGPITVEGIDGGTVKISEPSAHTGHRPVQIRVLSPVHRTEMSPGVSSAQPASPYLVFHCHGGGYVATSSKSHETYLRMWAKLLNCTVVSVEYSLAPENPFPRPTEEVLYAYAWIINNPQLVGWTGEKICMVGDSAGGNLIMSVNMRLIQLGVKRQPDGIVPLYTPFLFQYIPSPSRLLSVMDPLLHTGVVLRCVAAYTGGYGKTPPTKDKQENGSHKSLQEYVDQVQRTKRIDFKGGPQSIVSLVQNVNNDENFNNGVVSNNADSLFAEEKPEEEDSDEDDTRSVSSVHVDADPLHIQISPSLFDNHLLTYLKKHPTTKDCMTLIDDKGDVLEPNDVETMPPLTDISDNEQPKEKKRPTLLGLLSGSTTSATAPTTPCENNGNKVFPTSQSSYSVAPPQHQPVHKRSLSQSLADTAVLAAGHAFDNLQDWIDRPMRNERQKLNRTFSHKESVPENEENLVEEKSHLLDLLNNSEAPRDPLISPMYATDEMLQKLPKTYFVGCHLDPLLDDTIAFATKMRNAGGKVSSVDLLPSVPHGFLNFTLISPECRRAAKLCLQRIKDALDFKAESA